MCFGEISVGEMSVWANIIRGPVRSGNCPFGELSFGDLSVGELSQNRKYSTIAKTQQYQTKSCNIVKKGLQHRCFSMKFPKYLRTSFLMEHLQWLLLTYNKSILLISQKLISQSFIYIYIYLSICLSIYIKI